MLSKACPKEHRSGGSQSPRRAMTNRNPAIGVSGPSGPGSAAPVLKGGRLIPSLLPPNEGTTLIPGAGRELAQRHHASSSHFTSALRSADRSAAQHVREAATARSGLASGFLPAFTHSRKSS